MPTIGIDFHFKVVDIDGCKVKIEIWDTAGQEKYRNITASYYKGGHGVLMVYAVNDEATFSHVERWMSEVQAVSPDIQKVLVGNKSDLPAQVLPERGERLAKTCSMSFFQTSSKTGEHVNEAIVALARACLRRLKDKPGCVHPHCAQAHCSHAHTAAPPVDLAQPPPKKHAACCP